jgi:AcrR family transcriptional regulator
MPATAAPTKGRKFRGLDAEQRQAERRARLIDAGLEAFGRHGFQSTTVKDVCSEAKLTERYFYESFANREELFAAVYQSCVADLKQRLLAVLTANPANAQALAQAGLRLLYQALRDDPRIARVLFLDVLSAHADMDRHSLNALEGFSALLEGYMEALCPQLREAKLDPTLIATGLVGAVVLLVTRWTITGFKEPIDEMVRNSAALFEALIAQVGGTPRC